MSPQGRPLLKPFLVGAGVVGGAILVFLLFSLLRDQALHPRAAQILEQPPTGVDAQHPIHLWIEKDAGWAESRCDTTADCLAHLQDAEPIAEAEYLSFLIALEDPRPFSIVRPGGGLADADPLMYATRQLALHIARDPDAYPPDLLRRVVSANRHWLATATTLMDKMMATAAMNALIDATRHVERAAPMPLFARSELSMRKTYEGEMRFARRVLRTGDTPGSNIVMKPNYTMNLIYAQMEHLSAASERQGCDFWRKTPSFSWSGWHRLLNPAGEVLAMVAEPAYSSYGSEVARLNLRIALTNAYNQQADPSAWQSPLECWQSRYLEASSELCLVPVAELAGEVMRLCLPYQLEKLEGS